ncbi:hypothetical protein DNF23_49520 [Pseudomonas syringae pv. pisi]|nr:DUF1534 domain-containing protein [Pseudomonas syringae]PYD13065.1 hypothetical protein DND47_21090 [Pseudomonas syringae pv. syringae]MCF5210828.1 DUF1534 domain-containing protein [Pseudomonas syringae]MCF5216419.1 DUF1534 domain-containing protein [Pseudomonas syringae]MCF5221570.1 DUF1534 domain-containing protein [Pseudomonas syringae]
MPSPGHLSFLTLPRVSDNHMAARLSFRTLQRGNAVRDAPRHTVER